MSKIKNIIWPQIILFGDSITQVSFQPNGWGSEMANKVVRKCDVVNRGLSGYNSRWAKVVLPRLISKENASSNHIAAVTEYSENLKDIVKHLGSVGSALNRLNSVAGQYAQACVQAAGQCGADVLDLWTLMQKDGQDFTGYLSDGLHLSEKGNQFVAQHLWRLLESRVEELPFILPYWGDVDPKQPESSLLCD
ncbi:unnamed protein product [Coregonus sp. 'balchen']|nr:unnamed protein product [Coregonus sp. 'balchen']